MKNYIFILFSLLISGALVGQKSPWGNSNHWKNNKTEFYMQIGATQFMGDVGGADEIGTPNSLRDMNISSTRMGFGAGFRFRLNSRLATSTQLYLGMLSGSDKNTEEFARNSRNLSFRSPIVELSQRLEFIVYADEKEGAVYLDGGRPRGDVVYLFTGISGFFFNPQTRLGGKWVNLIPLKTEGQGLPEGAKKYSPVSVAIPFGIGFKLAITEDWRVGMDVSYNKTFTDYIDDVSTRYYDPQILLEQVGEDAVRAANPSKPEHQDLFIPGEKRGNPDNKDAYFFLNLTFTKNITGGSSKKTKWNRI